MQMLEVIKNLIIIHLGSMRERIRPNRWINSERRDERLEGESAEHHLSACASSSGLHFAGKLQEAQEKGVLGFHLRAWVASQSWGTFLSTDYWGGGCFLRLGHGLENTLNWVPPFILELWNIFSFSFHLHLSFYHHITFFIIQKAY